MDTMAKIARLDRQMRRLAPQMLTSPLAAMEMDALLDQRLALMADRDRGYTESHRRVWRR